MQDESHTNDMGSDSGTDSIPKPILFDVSLEVAHKIGGIYTVIKSKTPFMKRHYNDNMCLLGPYIPKDASMEFESLQYSQLGPAIEAMQNDYGVRIHYGRWLVEGYPRAVLFDMAYPDTYRSVIDRHRDYLRHNYHVDIPDRNEAVPSTVFVWDAFVFGSMVSTFLTLVKREVFGESNTRDIVVHFHEWMASVGLLLLNWEMEINPQLFSPPLATCFTTHATQVGRHLCAGSANLYNDIDEHNIDGDAEARKRGIWIEHTIEKQSAHKADVFTTVSDVTSTEARCILGKQPDIVTVNGLPPQNLDLLHHLQIQHQNSKSMIADFVRGHFAGHMTEINLDETFYFFSAGRYEYINKGVDVTLSALRRLNDMMIATGATQTVVCFLIFPTPTTNFHVDTLRGISVRNDIQSVADQIGASVSAKVAEAATKGRLVDPADLLSNADTVKVRRLIQQLQRAEFPPVVTHQLVDSGADPILTKVRELQMFNQPGDRVKVVFHPAFVSSSSPVLRMDYPDFVRGCHLGCFPSYYEPFGYTPAECMQVGVASITSNVSGFGAFVEHIETDKATEEDFWRSTRTGVNVVDRRYISADETIERVAQTMYQYTQLSRRERCDLRSKTERASLKVGWDRVGERYIEAHTMALAKVAKRME